MASPFLLLLFCSSKFTLGEEVMGKVTQVKVKIEKANETGEANMGMLANETKIRVLNTMERVGELVEVKEMKDVGEPREKRASFYKSGGELAWQVLTSLPRST